MSGEPTPREVIEDMKRLAGQLDAMKPDTRGRYVGTHPDRMVPASGKYEVEDSMSTKMSLLYGKFGDCWVHAWTEAGDYNPTPTIYMEICPTGGDCRCVYVTLPPDAVSEIEERIKWHREDAARVAKEEEQREQEPPR